MPNVRCGCGAEVYVRQKVRGWEVVWESQARVVCEELQVNLKGKGRVAPSEIECERIQRLVSVEMDRYRRR